MNNKKVFYSIVGSIILAVLSLLVNPYRFISLEYDLILGQIADKDIIAPFEFYIYKTNKTLAAEQETAAAKIQPVYTVSENLKFNAQKNLDFIMQFFIHNNDITESKIADNLKKSGYSLSIESIQYLRNSDQRTNLYSSLTEQLARIFTIGIYPEVYSYQKIKIYRNYKVEEFTLPRLYSLDEARSKLIILYNDPIEKEVIKELSNILLISNIIVDKDLTAIDKQKAKDAVDLTIGKVLKNERIVEKNQKVTYTELLKLKSLMRAQEDHHSSKSNLAILLSSLGTFGFILILLTILDYIIMLHLPKEFHSADKFMVLILTFVFSALATVIVNRVLEVNSLLIPFSMSVLLIGIIYKPFFAMIYNFFSLLVVALFLNWDFTNISIMCISTMGGLLAINQVKKKKEFYPITIYLSISFLIVNILYMLINFQSLDVFFAHLGFGYTSIMISIMGFMLLIPFIERKLNMATKQLLLELLDFDNPLLKRMSMVSPGTYHHALIVGNLAESSAEAIGANHLLARVGSYYHDIGKIENPKFFIENNPKSSDIHDNMLATESAIVIRKHIDDGIKLAKKYKLPKPIIDIIQQHHGTSKIRFFYMKAKETNLVADETEFQYKGPKPQTKEAAIVMIADIVESTTKSLDDITEEKIKKILDKSISQLIVEGQLDDAPITIKELQIIKIYMLPILMGVYRKRLEYPE